MPRTANVYAAPSNSFNPAVQGEPIDQDDWNAILADLVAGLNSSPEDASYVGSTIQPWVTLTLASGANTDVTLPAGTNFIIAGPSGSFSLTGLTGGADGRLIRVYNAVAQEMTLANDATSTEANRFLTLTGSDVVTTTQGLFQFVYNTAASRWIMVSAQT